MTVTDKRLAGSKLLTNRLAPSARQRAVVKRCPPHGFGLFLEIEGKIEDVPSVGYGLRSAALAASETWGLEVVDQTRSRQQAWKAAHPEAVEAHRAVRLALRRGMLVKASCIDCGDPNAEAHHPDYSKPLAVEWLCRKHHRARHRAKIVKGPKG